MSKARRIWTALCLLMIALTFSVPVLSADTGPESVSLQSLRVLGVARRWAESPRVRTRSVSDEDDLETNRSSAPPTVALVQARRGFRCETPRRCTMSDLTQVAFVAGTWSCTCARGPPASSASRPFNAPIA